MCGIIGFLSHDPSLKEQTVFAATNALFKLSESRGKEASGLALCLKEEILVLKENLPSSQLIRQKKYKQIIQKGVQRARENHNPFILIGHSRLVTDSQQEKLPHNNQPVISSGLVGVHNGIIVNADSLWKKFPLQRQYQVDTEAFLALTEHFTRERHSLRQAVQSAFAQIEGVASIALLSNRHNELILSTNNGSLYISRDEDRKVCLFASERYILESIIKKIHLYGNRFSLKHIPAGRGESINLEDLSFQGFDLNPASHSSAALETSRSRKIVHVAGNAPVPARFTSMPVLNKMPDVTEFEKAYEETSWAVKNLKRCSQCILPETMPFIEFDQHGICSYCRMYKRIKVHGKEVLEKIVAPHRTNEDKPNCLVGLSGGRDSCYGLHYIKRALGMNPVAYTYDWGMVTDIARRNASRMCAKLGVEHILVSADIALKRRFIHRNVSAWLHQPDLGMIPLFMAGDKQYFYYAYKLKNQLNVPLAFMCENMLERTNFKTGFSRIKPYADENFVYTLSPWNKFQLFSYYGKNYLKNPRYMNLSVADTLFASWCYYGIRQNYFNLYKFISWDESEIISTLRNEYDWETDEGTPTTWRIGDGTASFYNYIYYTVAGFSEHDTFRSNQIREGQIKREDALKLVEQENRPRFEAVKLYCDLINIDFKNALETIGRIPKFYSRRPHARAHT